MVFSMNKRIEFLIILKNLNVNGISNVVLNYIKNFNRDKYNITICCSLPIANIYFQECKNNGFKLIELPSKKHLFQYLHKLSKIYKKKFDIVEFEANSSLIFFELLLAWIKRIPLRVVHSHNTTSNYKLLHFILRPLVCCFSNLKIACDINSGRWMFKNKKFYVANNGIYTEKFIYSKEESLYLRQKLGLDNDIFIIGHTGRLNEQKNQIFLLDIYEEYLKINDNSLLILVGNGPLKEKLITIAKQRELLNKILFLGEINYTDKIYNLFDIFVFPSLYEGFPLSLIEAQANNCPCLISSKINKQVVLNNRIFFESLENNAKNWAKKIEEIRNINFSREFNDDETRIEDFNIKNLASKYEMILENKLNKITKL